MAIELVKSVVRPVLAVVTFQTDAVDIENGIWIQGHVVHLVDHGHARQWIDWRQASHFIGQRIFFNHKGCASASHWCSRRCQLHLIFKARVVFEQVVPVDAIRVHNALFNNGTLIKVAACTAFKHAKDLSAAWSVVVTWVEGIFHKGDVEVQRTWAFVACGRGCFAFILIEQHVGVGRHRHSNLIGFRVRHSGGF